MGAALVHCKSMTLLLRVMLLLSEVNGNNCLFYAAGMPLGVLPFAVGVSGENKSYRKYCWNVFLKFDSAQYRVVQDGVAIADESYFSQPVEFITIAGDNASMFAGCSGFAGAGRIVIVFNQAGGSLSVNSVVKMHKQHKRGDNDDENSGYPEEFQKFLSLRWR